MFTKTVMGLSLFSVLCNFMIYSFFGWIYESTFVSLRNKSFTNRGFMNGPIIPIYGFGGTMIYLMFFNPSMIGLVQTVTVLHVILIFLFGMLFASLLEYVTSYTMEKLFHAKWWDYSDYPYNINGRISLRSSLFWGLLSVLGAYLLQPFVIRFMSHVKHPVADYILYVVYAVAALDFAITVNATLKLPQKLDAIERIKELKNKLKNSKEMELLNLLRNSRTHEHVYRRMFKAFPRMNMKGRQQLLEDFKDKIHSLRRKK